MSAADAQGLEAPHARAIREAIELLQSIEQQQQQQQQQPPPPDQQPPDGDMHDLNDMVDQARKENTSHSFRHRRHRPSRTNMLINASSTPMSSSRFPRLARRMRVANQWVPVFEPESKWLALWQLTIFAFVLTSAIVVPLMVAFEAEMPLKVRSSLHVMDKVFDVAFIIDLLFSFNIAFREDGFTVRMRKLIAIKYLKGWFVLDFISSLPLSWIIEDGDDPTGSARLLADAENSPGASENVAKINKLLRMLKLGKLLRILKLFKIFDMVANEMHLNPASFRLLGLAFGLFYIAHLFGCVWYMIISWSGGTLDDYASHLATRHESAPHEASAATTTYSYPHDSRYPLDELLAATQLGPDGVARKWMLCFVFAIGLFTGLMPIEMTPWRMEEMIFCVGSLVIAMVFNAMIISSCSSAMAAMDSVARHHKAKLDRVKDFMRFNNVPSEVTGQVLDFYKYIAINSQTKDDLKDFDDLPKHLHLKLTIGLHRNLITKCPLFFEFDSSTILHILRLLRPCTLPPETVVMRQGHPHAAMFWITRGMCWVVDINVREPDSTPRHEGTLCDQEFFGDETVLSENLVIPKRSIISKSYCVLMQLTRADYQSVDPRLRGDKRSGAHSTQERIQTVVDAIKRERAEGSSPKPMRSPGSFKKRCSPAATPTGTSPAGSPPERSVSAPFMRSSARWSPQVETTPSSLSRSPTSQTQIPRECSPLQPSSQSLHGGGIITSQSFWTQRNRSASKEGPTYSSQSLWTPRNRSASKEGPSYLPKRSFSGATPVMEALARHKDDDTTHSGNCYRAKGVARVSSNSSSSSTAATASPATVATADAAPAAVTPPPAVAPPLPPPASIRPPRGRQRDSFVVADVMNDIVAEVVDSLEPQ